jgi:type IV pilus assembly protein PilN
VILINLLPHREARRRQRKQNFFIALGVAAAAGLLVVAAWYTVLQQMRAAQEQRNDLLRAENQKLDTQIKDIATLRTEIQALKDRQAAVEDLQTDRNTPVHLLDELSKQAPEGVYLSSIRQNGRSVTVVGTAQTNERVSEFLRNTLHHSAWLEKPDLVEIKASALGARERSAREREPEQRRLFDFTIRLSIKQAVAVDAAASAPRGAPAARGAAAKAS